MSMEDTTTTILDLAKIAKDAPEDLRIEIIEHMKLLRMPLIGAQPDIDLPPVFADMARQSMSKHKETVIGPEHKVTLEKLGRRLGVSS